jgi:hypothetical protein
MEKRASNTFVAGLNTDRHPLTAQNTELIEAQNIDLVQVGAGYQLILQKREGNLEVLIIPPAYESAKIYYIGEYVLRNNLAYKSLQDTQSGHTPETSPAFWEALTTNNVPAGLKEGFIPLAVKEFNNIAYIVSVKPNADPDLAGIGELGTFPSPDYDLFKYEEGTERVGDATIGPGVYDSAVATPEFGFTILLDPDTGDLEYVNAEFTSEWSLAKSHFTLINDGYTPEAYTIVLDNTESGNLNIYYKINNAGPDILYAGPVTLNNPGDFLYVGANAIDPWLVEPTIDSPNDYHNRTFTITTASGQPAQTVDFQFTAIPMSQIRRSGTLPWYQHIPYNVVSTGEDDVRWDMRTNVTGAITHVSIDPPDIGIGGLAIPAWISDNMLVGGQLTLPSPTGDFFSINPQNDECIKFYIKADVVGSTYTMIIYSAFDVWAEMCTIIITLTL